MDAVLGKIEQAVESLGLRGQHILVAVSGGLDSSVLLHALAAVTDSCGLRVSVGHVNHGLRGAESEGDQKAVEAMAVGLGLPCRVTRIEVESAREGHSSRSRPTPQEAARTLRYEALEAMAETLAADRIATAHHLDDQAETVLMRMLRGCGPDGLGGIAESSRDGLIVRPLLWASLAEIRAYAEAAGVVWREDSSNASDRYTRNRVRRDWLPALSEAFNPQLARTLGQLAESHRRDAEWIADLVEAEFRNRFEIDSEQRIKIPKAGWGEVPEALARRLVVRAFHELGAGRDLSRVHIERTLAFLREGVSAPGGREVELPGGLRLLRTRQHLLLYRKNPESA
ncbi:MAG: tRNA lysidine(34) synthetase TilS [Myxococcales bacterium]|nr:tRNA lysidine(34) synthetase TilS [Myxococcales bacterium]